MKRTALKRKTPLKTTSFKKVVKKVVSKKVVSKKKKEKTQVQLKKKLDTIFSLFIRQSFPPKCYTCGKIGTPQTLQNGHFISRQYLATRWDINNCRPQCVGCNIFGNGKLLDFEDKLKRDLGDSFVEDMKSSRHISLKLDRNWYKERISFYKEKLK